MKRILGYIYFIILIILSSIQLFATNWYVDNTASGSNNGTSWTNAWQSLADINWASISAGDNIYISGGSSGKVYAEQLAPECIGTAVNYISILPGKYSPSPSGHNGKVTIKYVLIDEYAGTIAKYVRIKGFEITGNDGGGVRFDADLGWAKGIIIDSCYIHDYGTGFGIAVLAYCDSTIIQNNIILDCEVGDCAGDRDGIHVNEDAGHIPKTTIIRNNWVRVTSQDPNAHNDAFQSVSGDGFYVYNNVFINDSVNSPEGGGMPSILSAVDADNNDSPPVLVFNNFMFMNGIWYSGANQGWVYELRHDAGTTWNQILPTYVFGNTMVSNGPRNRVFGNGEAYVNLALNNIWASYCTSSSTYRTGAGHGWMEVLGLGAVYTSHYMYQDSIRNNLFWRQDSTEGQSGNQSAMIVGDGYIYGIGGTGGFDGDTPFADWIAKGGTGLFRDPQLVTPFGRLSDQGSATPDIKPNSPAIDAGEDYSYLVNYLGTTYPVIPQDVLDAILVDFYGNPRGADGNWDIGAVEYQDGSWTPPDTIPSFSFTGLNNRELNTAYTGSATFSGADSTFHVWTTTGARFNINSSSSLSTTMKTAVNGDVVYVENISSASYSTGTTETIVAGGVSRSFNVTTKSEPVLTSGTKKVRLSNGKVLKDSSGKVIKVQ